jgi:hypothetical protein
MVGPVIEEVARLLVRQQDPPARRQGDAAGILARHPPGAVAGEHGAGGLRRGAGESGDFRRGHRLGAEQRIAQRLAQGDFQPPLRRSGQVAQIDAQGLGDPDQEAAADAALIVLDQVQIAGRDAKTSAEACCDRRRSVRSRRTVRPI